MKQSPFEQLQNKVCKNILRVRDYCNGKAAKAELARYPLILHNAQMTCNFYSKRVSNKNKLALTYCRYIIDYAI